MSAAPRAPIQQAPCQVGRLPVQDKEERRPIGQLVHAVESHGMGTAAHLARATELTGEHFPIADAGCDAAVDQIEAGDEQAITHIESVLRSPMLSDGTRRELNVALARLRENRRHFAEYRRQDASEDGTIRQANDEERLAQVQNRGVLALCEAAMTGTVRNQPKRRTTPATQMELGQ